MILSRLRDLLNLFLPAGRSGRQEYLTALGLSICLSIALMVLLGRFSSTGWVEGPAMILPVLCMFGLPTLAAIRRFHDLGEPTEQTVYLLLPIVGVWYFFRLIFKRGDAGDNEFGTDPRARMTSYWRMILGLLLVSSLGLGVFIGLD